MEFGTFSARVEKEQDKIITAFNNYFNYILKDTLNYLETFQIIVNLENREIILQSAQKSQLIQELINDNIFLEKLHLRLLKYCLLYTSPSPRDRQRSRMPSSA